MQHYKSILIYGFAIFAMFFGSGNLVFPLQIGYAAGDSWMMGFAGLMLTGILLPLMGLFVIKLYHGNYQAFFGSAGKMAGVFLPLIMLSLLGSFGVVPRCITVAYGSFSYMMPQIKLMPFSLLFCLITFFFCLNDKVMVKILGKWMSPILLISLIVMIVVAVFKAPTTESTVLADAAFLNGFTTGYQTMDLFAAFFFSALIFTQIQQQYPKASNREVLLFAIKPSILGASLLALIYFGFVFLGSHYTSLLKNTAPELMLPRIAAQTMGNYATLFIGVAMFFSCLTTAVALNNLYARYLCSALKVKEDKFYLFLLATTGVSFIISLLDFRGIAAFLSPILELTYPGVIALTVMAILLKEMHALRKAVFYVMTFFMCVPMAIH
ncbi:MULTISPECIES: branched-chain amino acid transport system II carrier protein [Legionella]|uniref:Branched-chain amino acid transport system carrier protein n=1 Tax=Legionella maceachernii TaxID=466 RepID=A0A0W0WGZ1_9GAMM|nr:branched-chain amino acid transport system II carrier protein [Legionella maceachernii]KTD31568.1 Branched-chain amino acid transport system 2 carrier protein [Legionella maceachernii]SKA11463.1 branched-chain amino acid:cation transporter, LIVCS family [Legionella maceachernii]SUO99607.1 LIV-II [Legionella maceachernii]